MHFQLVSISDLALIIESSTITRRVSERIDAFEAEHPVIGRLLVEVDADPAIVNKPGVVYARV